jgi:hypothetical protein
VYDYSLKVPAPPPAWGPKRTPVPYITPWSGERISVRTLTARPDGTGLCYRDETPTDRDAHGVLWSRLVEAPGRGLPNFRSVHPLRQRRAILEKLCQVGGGPASRTDRGWLLLFRRPTPVAEARDWPEGVHCMKPPVCLGCAAIALRHCPHLTRTVAVRSRKPRTRGVFGALYSPDATGSLVARSDGCIPYGHRDRPWFLASQLVVELRRCTVVDLDAELAR